jgi:cellobiose phosphorylase
MAADVYEREPHTGRGGWTWYTGAAGWMYRVGIDGILGLKLKGDKGFSLEPVVPKEWNGFQIKYKHNGATYIIDAKKGEKSKITIDGKLIQDSIIPYGDKGEHHIEVIYETSKVRSEMVCQ